MRVHFNNFWNGFQPGEFFLPLLSLGFERPVTLERELARAHIVIEALPPVHSRLQRIASHLYRGPRLSRRGTDGRKILFSGENVRPPVGSQLLSMTFDSDSYRGANVYLPLIYLGLDWFGQANPRNLSPEFSRLGLVPEPSTVHQERIPSRTRRFACAFIGNPEPVRMRALEYLREIGEVEVFGSSFGRKVRSKADMATDFQFMLAFENDIYPGYVTEKPLDAWMCHAIPLWRGNDVRGILNDSALVNAADFASLESWAEHVAALKEDSERMESMRSARLFAHEPSLDEVVEALRNVARRAAWLP